jgi:hypothetical protein
MSVSEQSGLRASDEVAYTFSLRLSSPRINRGESLYMTIIDLYLAFRSRQVIGMVILFGPHHNNNESGQDTKKPDLV